ncbi:seminal vesicle antigen-like 3 precursor [Mus musculus]|uniref:Prolactin-induced protein n=1 Tax=Mus musculus TaxID=10090 RepID=Q76I99_MOUSE|eukprot:NP_001003952.1 seminal vesicle antigen-like 3 precursor [Mus musculus]
MASLQILQQTGGVMLLILSLLLETAYGQDNRNKSLSLNRRLSQTNRTNEVIVELTVTNNVDKCLGIEISTEDNPNIKYLSTPEIPLACVCTSAKFFWNVHVSENAVLQMKVEVFSEKDICNDDNTQHLVTIYLRYTLYKLLEIE